MSMPSFKSKERTEHNQPMYNDLCNPITSEFRKEFYDDILSLYAEVEQSGKTEVSREAENVEELMFREKLYDALIDCNQQERDKAMNQGMSRQPHRNLLFR